VRIAESDYQPSLGGSRSLSSQCETRKKKLCTYLILVAHQCVSGTQASPPLQLLYWFDVSPSSKVIQLSQYTRRSDYRMRYRFLVDSTCADIVRDSGRGLAA